MTETTVPFLFSMKTVNCLIAIVNSPLNSDQFTLIDNADGLALASGDGLRRYEVDGGVDAEHDLNSSRKLLLHRENLADLIGEDGVNYNSTNLEAVCEGMINDGRNLSANVCWLDIQNFKKKNDVQ